MEARDVFCVSFVTGTPTHEFDVRIHSTSSSAPLNRISPLFLGVQDTRAGKREKRSSLLIRFGLEDVFRAFVAQDVSQHIVES